MPARSFEFELYRMNLVQAPPVLFDQMNRPVTEDKDIVRILEQAVKPRFKWFYKGPKNQFEWAVRDLCRHPYLGEDRGDVFGLTIARSLLESSGDVVTDDGIEPGTSEAEPPLAGTCRMFFYMRRHLALIERKSIVTNSRWRQALQNLLKSAALKVGYNGWIEFEPVPRHEEVLEAFRSFDPLTRLRVILRLPNPELSQYARHLYDEMDEGGIKEYLQDMKNPRGLNKENGKLPHASTEIAAAGYKVGEVTFEG